MAIRARLFGLGLIVCGLAAWLGATALDRDLPATAPSPACTASGGKLFSPPLDETQVCERFIAGLAAAGAETQSLTVSLIFQPQGLAIANIARAADPLGRFELAVSDRGFAAQDLDRLAADAAAGLVQASAK